MDVWLAPDNKNRDAFINTLLCMQYSEDEVAPLKKKILPPRLLAQ